MEYLLNSPTGFGLFLQRIVNGGGRIERGYGLGRLRTDLLVLWPWLGGVQKAVNELSPFGLGSPRMCIGFGIYDGRSIWARCTEVLVDAQSIVSKEANRADQIIEKPQRVW